MMSSARDLLTARLQWADGQTEKVGGGGLGVEEGDRVLQQVSSALS